MHKRVEAEITRLLYAQAPVGFLATLVNASILVGVLHTEVPQPIILYAWLGTLFVVTALRLLLVRAYKRAHPNVEQAPRWRRFFILGIVSTGVAWGSASVVVFPPELPDQVFLAFVLGGMSAGAITIMASARYTPLGFLLPVLGPLAARFFYQGNDLGVPMGVMVVLFFCGLMLAVRPTRAATVEAFRLRFTNLDLIDQVTQQASDLVKTNSTLQSEIAGHKDTMQALQESEQRFRQLAENVSHVFWVTDLATQKILYVNPAYERLWGRSCESLYEQPSSWKEGVHPDDRELACPTLPQQSKQGESVEYRLVRPNGVVRWVWARTFLVKNEQGEPYRQVGIVEDITAHKHLEEELERRVEQRTEQLRAANQQLEAEMAERRHAEDSLQRSEELFRSLIEDASDLISILDNDGTVLYVSPSHQRVLSYTSEDLVRKNAFTFIHPDDLSGVLNIFSLTQADRTDGLIPPTYRFRHQNGSWRMLESVGKNLPENSTIRGMIINSRDVTDRKHAEEALQESELRYRSLVESTHDLVQSVSLAGHFLLVNSAWLNTLGYTAEEVPLLTLFQIIHPDFQSQCQALFAKVMAGREFRHVRIAFIAKDGRTIPVEGTVSGRYQDGQLVATHGFFRDITEQVRFEEEKHQLQAQLVQMQKLQAVGALAGGIAHDFNNLLTPIIGFSELLKKGVPLGTTARNNLEEVLKAGHRAKDLVQQLLEFSRPSTQSRRPVIIEHEVEESLRLLRAVLPKTVAIHTTLAASHSIMVADPTHLHQIVMNLGVNAVQAMGDHAGELEISLQKVDIEEQFARAHPPLTPGTYNKLRVRDTGCGMTAEVMTRIFDPFFTTKPIGEGTGLGLSVVHGIIMSYGGAITVESAPGRGTTFEVYLPCAAGIITTEEPRVEPMLQGSGCILCVDDEATVALVMQQMLEELGYEVVTATSGHEAATIFRQTPERFDVVVTDQTMPGLTGEQLTRELHSVRPYLPVILCSGFSSTLTEKRIQALGLAGYLKKPFSKEELGDALHRAFCADKETQLL
ncbi:MAG: PAS domain S-box protein [Deltaproteobacteria bacterium]|nr:PAS domain S-box protein [Deltaproteobacteria bacterium]